jgi:hypothetical protein
MARLHSAGSKRRVQLLPCAAAANAYLPGRHKQQKQQQADTANIGCSAAAPAAAAAAMHLLLLQASMPQAPASAVKLPLPQASACLALLLTAAATLPHHQLPLSKATAETLCCCFQLPQRCASPCYCAAAAPKPQLTPCSAASSCRNAVPAHAAALPLPQSRS